MKILDALLALALALIGAAALLGAVEPLPAIAFGVCNLAAAKVMEAS